eukprot:EG_transcript_22736
MAAAAAVPPVQATALVVIDMSVEQFGCVQYKAQDTVATIQRLAQLPWRLKIDSRLWLSSPEESSLSWVFPCWGTTMGVPGAAGSKLIPDLEGLGLQFVPKKNYSSLCDSDLGRILRDAGVERVALVGINTDYCVFATALDAFMQKFHTVVVADGVTSIAGQEANDAALHRIKKHFGPSAVVPSSAFFPKD